MKDKELLNRPTEEDVSEQVHLANPYKTKWACEDKKP